MSNPKVIVIPANPELSLKANADRPLRVAAYCRVSTDEEEQLNSYETQKKYYTETIKNNKNWVLIGIFADEGLSGTSAKKRPEFLRMIRQCKQKKIDLILTKSISRFARNTVDCLSYIRVLKSLGIPVIFEKENINSMNQDSEFLITLHGAFAQQESESISANVRWGKRQAMREGRAKIAFKRLYGYRRGEDDKPQIVSEQAAVVREIYDRFLSGESLRMICNKLNARKIPTVTEKGKWGVGAIRDILGNEKYCGDVLLQKTFVEDCISKKVVKNVGQLPMYLIRNHHKGIVDRATFDAAQSELKRRNALESASAEKSATGRGSYASKYALSERLVCGECGARYRRCTWTASGRKRIVWRCINRLNHAKKLCHDSPTLDEDALQAAILNAISASMSDRHVLLDQLNRAMEQELAPNGVGERSLSDIDEQLDEAQRRFDKLLAVAADEGADAYEAQFQTLMEQMTTLREERAQIIAAFQEDGVSAQRLKSIRDALECAPIRLEWNEAVIRQLVENVRVISGEEIDVKFKEGDAMQQRIKQGNA